MRNQKKNKIKKTVVVLTDMHESLYVQRVLQAANETFH